MYVYDVGLHLVVLHWCGKLKHFLWFRLGLYYRAEKRYNKCLVNLRSKGKLHANIFQVELILISLSHISQGDSWILVNWIICYYFGFTLKSLQLGHEKEIVAAQYFKYIIRDERRKVL